MTGGEDEETHLSREGRYRIVTIRPKQACVQILRRISGARFEKRWKVVALFGIIFWRAMGGCDGIAFGGMFCSLRGKCDVFDIMLSF